MEKEIEAKFVDVDHDELRQKLEKLGGKMISPMTLQRRIVFKLDPDPSTHDDYQWFRLRDEGDKITLAHKHYKANTVDGVEEVQVEVSDFDKTAQILSGSGLRQLSEQVNKREVWQVDSTHVMLDVWPHINPIVEVEGPTEQDVKDLSKKLDFNWDDAIFGTPDDVYQAYFDIDNGFMVTGLPKLDFDTPLPKGIEAKRK